VLLVIEAAFADGSDPLDQVVGHGGFAFDAADAGGCAAIADPVETAGIAFGGTLSAMPASAARAAVREVTAALAPGSAVVASGVSYADEGFGQAQAARFREAAGVTWYSHSPQDMASIFAAAGLAGGDGGPVTVADVQWPPPEGPRRGMVLGATGFKD